MKLIIAAVLAVAAAACDLAYFTIKTVIPGIKGDPDFPDLYASDPHWLAAGLALALIAGATAVSHLTSERVR